MLSVPANSEHINESSLLKKASAGDRIAFTTLYTHYFPRLYRFVFFINQSREDTEEILQEVFLKIWDKKESLLRIRSFEDYLFRMAKNKLFDLAKKNKMIHRLMPQQVQTVSDATDEVTYKEYHRVAMEAITHLPERKRTVFLMSVEEDMSLDEIASELKISRSAVKKHLYAAVRTIKEHLRLHAEWTVGMAIFLLL
ncbi:sigma-70 family RNA polymerase sigma factor [Chitinophaga sp. SYP-B3965]|uniref:RNA polymerase sigma factor n=1 Tax=Chitinophaga sp. SYP-B3965 TaxID=2663120 RepID=UPI001299D17B|nr:sigma-70 family RNA polymerase sigma factor [Chitinophaga sp. SYP-B3965]MRG43985.1 sigma-70 family RNA polymerase sigma factor [Chitinophaga sp. SYP-B3965]